QDAFPRELADINGDGKADIVGFGACGVCGSINTSTAGSRSFPLHSSFPFQAFGSTDGWSSQDAYPRLLADTTGDGKADIVSFGASGVWVSTSNSTGKSISFRQPTFVQGSSFWGAQTGGWSSQDAYPRELSDVNGDGKADIVGFGASGVWVSI